MKLHPPVAPKGHLAEDERLLDLRLLVLQGPTCPLYVSVVVVGFFGVDFAQPRCL